MSTLLNNAITPSTPKVKLRDHRLDFWRGVCLVDMVLVHLVFGGVNFGPWWLKQLLGEYMRFAAGGFIMVAGMTIVAIYGPRLADAASRARSYRSIWQRSLFLLAVHVASVVSFKVMDVLWGAPLDYPLSENIWRIVTLRYGSDLLLFYSVMLMAVPFVLEIIRRWKSIGVLLVLAVSLTLFKVNEPYPYALWPVQDGHFPVLLWQLLFITGMLAGKILPAYDTLRKAIKIQIAIGFTLFATTMYLLAYGPEWNLPIHQSILYFRKLPLSGGEVFRYIGVVGSIILWTDLAWATIRDWRISGLCADLGRRSLPVYICHVWLVSLSCWACQVFWWMEAWQSLFFPIVMTILLGIVYAMDYVERRKAADKPAKAQAKPVPAATPSWSSYLPRLSDLMPKLTFPATAFVLSCLGLFALLHTIRAPIELPTEEEGFMAAISEPSADEAIQEAPVNHVFDEWPRQTTSY